MTEPNLRTGLLAAVGILFMWSGFIVFARAGVLSGMTPYDIVAARFIVSGTLTLPFAWWWWPRHLPVGRQVLLALIGPGALYSGLMFTGLAQASAAYGGVFANGALPVLTMLLALAIAGAWPKRMEVVGSAIIILGGVMVAWRGLGQGGENVAQGIVLFLCASVLIAGYIYAIQQWRLTPRQALAVVNVPNALIFLPVWWAFLPSTMAEVDWQVVAAQMAFQGVGPGFLAMMMFALVAFHLGATPTAAVSASVPATAAILAIPVLGEMPEPLEWAGIATVTLGLVLLIRAR